MGQKYKLYGSKAPIWWSKMSEDRPSNAYFQAFPFNWELFEGYQVDWVSQFSGNVVIKDGEYTYFKQENTATGEITYWFVDDKSKQLTNGSVYILGLDIWATYNMGIYDDIPEDYNIGVERCHLIFDDYITYNSSCVIDDMLDFGYSGDTPHNLPEFITTDTTVAGSGGLVSVRYWQNKVGGSTTVREYASDTSSDTFPQSRSAVYVFANWNVDNDDKSTLGMQYLLFPVITLPYQGYGDDLSLITGKTPNGRPISFDTNKILGNTEYRLQGLVKERPNFFIGLFLLPPVDGAKTFVEESLEVNGKSVFYYYYPIALNGFQLSNINTRFFSTQWRYNALTSEINPYGFINSNRALNGNPITPHFYFRPDKLLISGTAMFGNGFRVVANSKDILPISGPLPVNKEAYAAYYKGIEQSMNAALKVSKDNAILGAVKGGVSFAMGGVQSALGAAMGDPVGVMKGISNASTGIFNIASNILNHQHTKATFEAQLADAKNSIQPAIVNSADQDIRSYIMLGGHSGGILLKKFTKSGAMFNNAIAFLFGVKVSNWVPKKALNDVAAKNPCFYIEMQPAFLKTNFTQYISKKYPKMNMKLKSVILDAWNKGYRIWKEECDLSKEYTYDIGRA